jgi:hypothetical protein
MTYFLSGFMPDGGAGLPATVHPWLLSAYPGAQIGYWQNINWNPSGRQVLGVTDAATEGAIAGDYRFPQVRAGDDPLSLTGYRNALLDALANWHATWTQQVVYKGTTYTLNANPNSQALFDKLKFALSAAAPTKQVQLYQSDGSKVTLAASDVIDVLASYGLSLVDRETGPGTGFNDLYFAILTAQTVGALDQITFG